MRKKNCVVPYRNRTTLVFFRPFVRSICHHIQFNVNYVRYSLFYECMCEILGYCSCIHVPSVWQQPIGYCVPIWTILSCSGNQLLLALHSKWNLVVKLTWLNSIQFTIYCTVAFVLHPSLSLSFCLHCNYNLYDYYWVCIAVAANERCENIDANLIKAVLQQ